MWEHKNIYIGGLYGNNQIEQVAVGVHRQSSGLAEDRSQEKGQESQPLGRLQRVSRQKEKSRKVREMRKGHQGKTAH